MSTIDDFMLKVIDLEEKEKEEIILFLAEAILMGNSYKFLKNISPKVNNIVLPFLTSVSIKINERIIKKGGEKVGTGTGLKNNQGRRA